MDQKIKVLALLSLIIAASIAGSIIFVALSTAKADTNTTAALVVQPSLSSVNGTYNGNLSISGFMGFRGLGDYRGMGMGMDRGFGGPRGFGSFQVSSDFTQNVTNIAQNDSDVQNLLNQGYNITSVRPVISTIIDGNGNIVTKASTSDLILQSNNGRAFVVVDLTQAKVTKIVTLTMTEIDK